MIIIPSFATIPLQTVTYRPHAASRGSRRAEENLNYGNECV